MHIGGVLCSGLRVVDERFLFLRDTPQCREGSIDGCAGQRRASRARGYGRGRGRAHIHARKEARTPEASKSVRTVGLPDVGVACLTALEFAERVQPVALHKSVSE